MMTFDEELNQIINELEKDFYKLQETDIFIKISDELKEWMSDPLQKIVIFLKKEDDIGRFRKIINNIRNINYSFTSQDTDDLTYFTSKVDTIIKTANRINNFKNSNTLDLVKLFNEMKQKNCYKDLNNDIVQEGRLKAFLPHLYSIVKHFQRPEDYPINYVFWRHIIDKILQKNKDYDGLCEVYRSIDVNGNNRHLKFAAYMETLGQNLANEIRNKCLVRRTEDENYQKLKKILNLPKYLNSSICIGTDIKNLKELYKKWLSNQAKDTSNKTTTYIRSIEILSEILNNNLFEINDIGYLTKLYNDLLVEQKNEKSKYYYKKAPSYGMNGFYSASIQSYVDFLNTSIPEHEKEKNMPNSSQQKQPLNQILYGPPGTGKTYNTVNKALEIIYNCSEKHILEKITHDTNISKEIKDIKDKQDKVKQVFEHYQEKGQIEFVTFHQSYGYEEFVEGIKAKTTDKGIEYKIESGIFKKLCEKSQEIVYKNDSIEFDSNSKIWKVSLAGSNDNPIKSKCYEDGYIRFSYEEKFKEDISANSDLNIPLNALVHKMNVGDIVVSLDTNKTINQIGIVESEYLYLEDVANYKHARKVKWLLPKANIIDFYEINGNTPFANSAIHEINPNKEKFFKLIQSQNIQIKENNKDKNYIIIIDEINRGNISKIFGELITLIEPSKRKGKGVEIRVKLPYSGDSEELFGVPSNLYIIGTMNTADRSIALMDTALRRRFEFTEMMPNLSVLSNDDEKVKDFNSNSKETNDLIVENSINIRLLLKKINQRIEYLYDRDHTIGHAYFMELKDSDKQNLETLSNIFRNKIIPLLQEYFYDDWEKIGLVLGDNQKANEKYQFIKIKNDDNVKKLFGDTSHELSDDEERKIYEINQSAFKEVESYKEIYEKN